MSGMPPRARVLVIEDTPMNQELVTDLLDGLGCDVMAAASAEEGLELARRQRPDLILMDVSLPGLDGLAATRALKADPATRDIRVVVLTAHAMRGDEARALAAGCDGYLSKPIDTRRFKECITGLLSASRRPRGDGS